MTYNIVESEHSLYLNLHLPTDLTITKTKKVETIQADGSKTTEYITYPEVNRTRLVKLMMDTLHPIYYYKVIYIYDEHLHKYVPDNGHIETFLSFVLNRLNLLTFDDHLIKEAKAAAKLSNTTTKFPFNPRNDVINCRNGIVILTIDGPVFHPHNQLSYQYLFNYCIGTNYNPVWERNTPRLYEILDQWGSRKFVIDSVAVGVAQSLVKDSFKTAFMAEGQKNAGKTTWLELARKTVGEDGFSQEGLIELSTSPFALASVEGKIINVGDEAQKLTPITTEVFKRIVGSILQPINNKYEKNRNGIITASYLFACNDLPEVKGNDNAFFGRWWIVEFKNIFEINYKIKEEILSDAMCEQYLVRIIERVQDIVRNGFKNPQSSDEVEELWRSRSVGSDMWISECIMFDDYNTTRISLAELHDKYSTWCKSQETPYPAVSATALREKLQTLGYAKVKTGGVIYFRGISYKFTPAKPKQINKLTQQEQLPSRWDCLSLECS